MVVARLRGGLCEGSIGVGFPALNALGLFSVLGGCLVNKLCRFGLKVLRWLWGSGKFTINHQIYLFVGS